MKDKILDLKDNPFSRLKRTVDETTGSFRPDGLEVEVNGLVTPLHIVPEWYFLSYYTMLKALPNKNAGFIILLTSILILLLFGESHYSFIFYFLRWMK